MCMRILYAFCAIVCLWGSSLASAQSAWLIATLSENDARFEEQAQLHLRDFKLVKQVATYPERFNDNNPIAVKSDPAGAIATLHDMSTGEPLESCETPCELKVNRTSDYWLALYKFAHEPVVFAAGYGDDLGTIWLGGNYMEIEKKHFTCMAKFEKRREKDRDAEVCIRTPPIMPSNAERSGHCDVLFDVSKKGRPINIKTTYCSDDIFSRPTIEAVSWWFYYPKVERGIE